MSGRLLWDGEDLVLCCGLWSLEAVVEGECGNSGRVDIWEGKGQNLSL